MNIKRTVPLAINFMVTLIFLCFYASPAYSWPYFIWDQKVDSDDKVICLTFDDGPNDGATERVLSVLGKHQVKATFFVIGKNVKHNPEMTKRILGEGHAIGNHSYSDGHFLAFQSAKTVRQNLIKTNEIIYQHTGYKPKYFRPPNGLMTSGIRRAADELDLIPVGVNVFVFDNIKRNSKKIADEIIKQINGGPLIVVLHDGFGTRKDPSRKVVAEALDIIIPRVKEMGYEFASLDACVEKKESVNK